MGIALSKQPMSMMFLIGLIRGLPSRSSSPGVAVALSPASIAGEVLDR